MPKSAQECPRVSGRAVSVQKFRYQREGGDPERFNGNSLAAMDGTGPMGHAIVLLLLLLLLLFPRRPLPASPAGIG